MKIGHIGSIKNIGGVVNLGEIYGDVSAGIDRSFKKSEEGGKDEQLERLHAELKKLAAAIQEHAGKVDSPGETLKRVGKLSEEVVSEDADKPLIERYLSLIGSAVASVPAIVQCVESIQKLASALFS